METTTRPVITIEALISAPAEKVWHAFNDPKQIVKWNSASPDWHSPFAENDLRDGGKFKYTMAAKDGSFSFDFEGTFTTVKPASLLEYVIGDGRKVKVTFTPMDNQTKVVTNFEAEETNPVDMQRGGWQAILDNFKKYLEAA